MLTGRLCASEPDGTLVLDVGGVGYELTTPLGTTGRATCEDGALTLHVHTHVREDALELFGFATSVDRQVFRTLLSISHVGPKLALSVLSAVAVGELARAVEQGDAAALTRIGNLAGLPGISIPCGFDGEGLPLGLQNVSKAWDDQAALDVAMVFQKETDFHKRRPDFKV